MFAENLFTMKCTHTHAHNQEGRSTSQSTTDRQRHEHTNSGQIRARGGIDSKGIIVKVKARSERVGVPRVGVVKMGVRR